MIEIIKKLRELVETIDLVSTSLSTEQAEWGKWWRNAATLAITKAIQSGWVQGEL